MPATHEKSLAREIRNIFKRDKADITDTYIARCIRIARIMDEDDALDNYIVDCCFSVKKARVILHFLDEVFELKPKPSDVKKIKENPGAISEMFELWWEDNYAGKMKKAQLTSEQSAKKRADRAVDRAGKKQKRQVADSEGETGQVAESEEAMEGALALNEVRNRDPKREHVRKEMERRLKELERRIVDLNNNEGINIDERAIRVVDIFDYTIVYFLEIIDSDIWTAIEKENLWDRFVFPLEAHAARFALGMSGYTFRWTYFPGNKTAWTHKHKAALLAELKARKIQGSMDLTTSPMTMKKALIDHLAYRLHPTFKKLVDKRGIYASGRYFRPISNELRTYAQEMEQEEDEPVEVLVENPQGLAVANGQSGSVSADGVITLGDQAQEHAS